MKRKKETERHMEQQPLHYYHLFGPAFSHCCGHGLRLSLSTAKKPRKLHLHSQSSQSKKHPSQPFRRSSRMFVDRRDMQQYIEIKLTALINLYSGKIILLDVSPVGFLALQIILPIPHSFCPFNVVIEGFWIQLLCCTPSIQGWQRKQLLPSSGLLRPHSGDFCFE